MNDVGFFVSRAPHRRLAGRVHSYLGHDRVSDPPLLRRLVALENVVVAIDFDSPVRTWVPGSPVPAAVSPVGGLSDRPMSYRTSGRERGVVVELTPLGARALFGCPLENITTSSVGLDDLLSVRARRLAERLWEAQDWAERFRVLDFWLTEWMLDCPGLPTQVQGTWREITRSSGRARVGDLAERAGWTRQHLTGRFREQVGLSPKTLSRIIRFHRAIRLGARPDPPRWADVAAACGYADQAHLNVDFRALAGCSPTELVAPGAPEVYLGVHTTTALRIAHQSARRTTSSGSDPSGGQPRQRRRL
jgi:AraC-like DNA-binding protein